MMQAKPAVLTKNQANFSPASPRLKGGGRQDARRGSHGRGRHHMNQDAESVAAQIAHQETAQPVEAPEALLVERCAQGDRHALEALLARHRTRAVSIAWRMLGDREEAEDIAQEAFVRVYRNLRNWRREGAFSTWLYRVVTNLCFDHLRKKSSTEQSMAMPETNRPEGDRETAIMVQQILGKLAAKLRAILILREVEGLDYQEIAKTLDIPLGTVRSRLSAARLAFRDLYLHYTSEAR